MDDLRDWEIELLIENISWATKNDWEQTRLIMYSSLMPYMKKGVKKDAKDLLPLPTDEDYTYQEHNYEVTDAQLEVMRAKSKKLEKIFKNKKNGKQSNSSNYSD